MSAMPEFKVHGRVSLWSPYCEAGEGTAAWTKVGCCNNGQRGQREEATHTSSPRGPLVRNSSSQDLPFPESWMNKGSILNFVVPPWKYKYCQYLF